MKKILLTLTLAFTAGIAFSQRSVDWSVESILQPTQLNSNASNQTPFAFEVVLKNNGADVVDPGDTITYQFKFVAGTTTFYVPNGAVYIYIMNKTLNSGDTMHLRGSFTLNVYAPSSLNLTLSVTSFVLNRRAVDGVVLETTNTANNTGSANMVWYNEKGWGVNVQDLTADQLFIAPNPAAETVKISPSILSSSDNMQVSITDMTGRVVYEETSAATSLDVNTSEFTSGMYIVTVKSGNLVSSSKLMIR